MLSRNSASKAAEKRERGVCPSGPPLTIILTAHVLQLSHVFLFDTFFDSAIMGTTLDSVNARSMPSEAEPLEVSTEEANALGTNGVTSLARLAFAACATSQTAFAGPERDARVRDRL